jgi:hypothetical protein
MLEVGHRCNCVPDKHRASTFVVRQRREAKCGQKLRAVIPLNLDGYLFGQRWDSAYGVWRSAGGCRGDFTGWGRTGGTFSRVQNVIRAAGRRRRAGDAA